MPTDIERVMSWLNNQHITRERFDDASVKSFQELEEEFARGEVRFIITKDKVICVRRAAQILAIDTSYKYLEAERFYIRDGTPVSNKKLGQSLKKYTVSETMRWSTESIFSPLESENALAAAIRGVEEECRITLSPKDLQQDPHDASTLPAVRKSSTYAFLHSCTYVRRFLVHPIKLRIFTETEHIFDNPVKKETISVIKQFPREANDYVRL